MESDDDPLLAGEILYLQYRMSLLPDTWLFRARPALVDGVGADAGRVASAGMVAALGGADGAMERGVDSGNDARA